VLTEVRFILAKTDQQSPSPPPGMDTSGRREWFNPNHAWAAAAKCNTC
jgi:hypothetical protein